MANNLDANKKCSTLPPAGSISATDAALALQGIQEQGLNVDADIFTSTLLSAPVRFDVSKEKIAAWLRESGCSSSPHGISTAARAPGPRPDADAPASAITKQIAALQAYAPSFDVTVEPGLRGLSWSLQTDQRRPLPSELCGKKTKNWAFAGSSSLPLSMAVCSADDDDDVATATDEQSEQQPEESPAPEPKEETTAVSDSETTTTATATESAPETATEAATEDATETAPKAAPETETPMPTPAVDSMHYETAVRRMGGAAGIGASEGAGLAGALFGGGFNSNFKGPLSNEDLAALIKEAKARGTAFGVSAGTVVLKAAKSSGLGLERGFAVSAVLAFQVSATVAWWHVVQGAITARGAARVAVFSGVIGLGGAGIGAFSLLLSCGWAVTTLGILAYKAGVAAGEHVPKATAVAANYTWDKMQVAWAKMKEQKAKLEDLRQQWQQHQQKKEQQQQQQQEKEKEKEKEQEAEAEAEEAQSQSPPAKSPPQTATLSLQPEPTLGRLPLLEADDDDDDELCVLHVHFALRLPSSKL